MIKLLYICQLAETDVLKPRVYEDFADGADDADWFETRLGEFGFTDLVAITKIRICLGETIPRDQAFDAAVVGGSLHMVAETRPWQLAILDWLKYWRKTEKPLLGICGGHQLMGLNVGAPVASLPGGTWSATKMVRPNPAVRDHWLFRDLQDGVPLHFGNTQHIAAPPPSATVLAAVEDSPAVILDFGGGWIGVQGHPEMTVEAFARYLEENGKSDLLKEFYESRTGPIILCNFFEYVDVTS